MAKKRNKAKIWGTTFGIFGLLGLGAVIGAPIALAENNTPVIQTRIENANGAILKTNTLLANQPAFLAINVLHGKVLGENHISLDTTLMAVANNAQRTVSFKVESNNGQITNHTFTYHVYQNHNIITLNQPQAFNYCGSVVNVTGSFSGNALQSVQSVIVGKHVYSSLKDVPNIVFNAKNQFSFPVSSKTPTKMQISIMYSNGDMYNLKMFNTAVSVLFATSPVINATIPNSITDTVFNNNLITPSYTYNVNITHLASVTPYSFSNVHVTLYDTTSDQIVPNGISASANGNESWQLTINANALVNGNTYKIVNTYDVTPTLPSIQSWVFTYHTITAYTPIIKVVDPSVAFSSTTPTQIYQSQIVTFKLKITNATSYQVTLNGDALTPNDGLYSFQASALGSYDLTIHAENAVYKQAIASAQYLFNCNLLPTISSSVQTLNIQNYQYGQSLTQKAISFNLDLQHFTQLANDNIAFNSKNLVAKVAGPKNISLNITNTESDIWNVSLLTSELGVNHSFSATYTLQFFYKLADGLTTHVLDIPLTYTLTVLPAVNINLQGSFKTTTNQTINFNNFVNNSTIWSNEPLNFKINNESNVVYQVTVDNQVINQNGLNTYNLKPTEAGNYSFTITAYNKFCPSLSKITKTYTFSVQAAPKPSAELSVQQTMVAVGTQLTFTGLAFAKGGVDATLTLTGGLMNVNGTKESTVTYQIPASDISSTGAFSYTITVPFNGHITAKLTVNQIADPYVAETATAYTTFNAYLNTTLNFNYNNLKANNLLVFLNDEKYLNTAFLTTALSSNDTFLNLNSIAVQNALANSFEQDYVLNSSIDGQNTSVTWNSVLSGTEWNLSNIYTKLQTSQALLDAVTFTPGSNSDLIASQIADILNSDSPYYHFIGQTTSTPVTYNVNVVNPQANVNLNKYVTVTYNQADSGSVFNTNNINSPFWSTYKNILDIPKWANMPTANSNDYVPNPLINPVNNYNDPYTKYAGQTRTNITSTVTINFPQWLSKLNIQNLTPTGAISWTYYGLNNPFRNWIYKTLDGNWFGDQWFVNHNYWFSQNANLNTSTEQTWNISSNILNKSYTNYQSLVNTSKKYFGYVGPATTTFGGQLSNLTDPTNSWGNLSLGTLTTNSTTKLKAYGFSVNWNDVAAYSYLFASDWISTGISWQSNGDLFWDQIGAYLTTNSANLTLTATVDNQQISLGQITALPNSTQYYGDSYTFLDSSGLANWHIFNNFNPMYTAHHDPHQF